MLWGECISGALYIGDFKRICRDVGFTDPRVLSISPIAVTDPELQKVVGEAKFFSITYRLFKIGSLETECEDYGQVAVYKGTIPGHPHSYALDDHHVFETNKPMLVCGNTASMVSETWLKPYFTVRSPVLQGAHRTHQFTSGVIFDPSHPLPHTHAPGLCSKFLYAIAATPVLPRPVFLPRQVTGDRSVHYGLFDCGAPSGGLPALTSSAGGGGGCGDGPAAAGGCCLLAAAVRLWLQAGGCCELDAAVRLWLQDVANWLRL